MKRPNSAIDVPEPIAKRIKTGPAKLPPLRTRQPGAILGLANPQDANLFDGQLSRALCVALHAVGFNGVKKDAFESLQGLTTEYMHRFMRRVKQSMQSSRRQQPLPQDFAHALASFDLKPASFTRDLQTKIPARVTQPPLLCRAPSTSTAPRSTYDPVLAKVLGGTSAKQRRRYVPAHFPNFPPLHTFRDTSIIAEREADARKIRELATEEGVSAEQSLRKLVAARKAGRSARSVTARGRGSGRALEGREEDAAFKDAMAAVLEEDKGKGGLRREDERLFLDGAVDNKGDEPEKEGKEDVELDLDSGPLVNYDRRHWRKGAANDVFGA